MKKIFVYIPVFMLILLSSFTKRGSLHKEFSTDQLILVRTSGWNNIDGKLNAYEWKRGRWVSVLQGIAVVTGRGGLAWGKGLHDVKLNRGKLKKEGDGNSPAGIFYLTGLFGYGDMISKMDYLKVDLNTFCVDDVNSGYYNKIVKGDTVKKDWMSAETMRLKSDGYKYGIFVDYNVNPAVKGEGSCIFMHIWGDENEPTAGCTAMTEENILKLVSFLDKKKRPVLVQVPESEYQNLRAAYRLP